MDASTNPATIHYYDTRLHEILCGQRGFEHRSTKHARNVTCQACLSVLRKQVAMGTLAPADAPAGGAGL